jgi:hypothetical protein
MGIYGILLSLNPVISLFFISSKNYIDWVSLAIVKTFLFPNENDNDDDNVIIIYLYFLCTHTVTKETCQCN